MAEVAEALHARDRRIAALEQQLRSQERYHLATAAIAHRDGRLEAAADAEAADVGAAVLAARDRGDTEAELRRRLREADRETAELQKEADALRMALAAARSRPRCEWGGGPCEDAAVVGESFDDGPPQLLPAIRQLRSRVAALAAGAPAVTLQPTEPDPVDSPHAGTSRAWRTLWACGLPEPAPPCDPVDFSPRNTAAVLGGGGADPSPYASSQSWAAPAPTSKPGVLAVHSSGWTGGGSGAEPRPHASEAPPRPSYGDRVQVSAPSPPARQHPPSRPSAGSARREFVAAYLRPLLS